MAAVKETVEAVAALEKYEHGFTSDIETEYAPRGLNADIIRFISDRPLRQPVAAKCSISARSLRTPL